MSWTKAAKSGGLNDSGVIAYLVRLHGAVWVKEQVEVERQRVLELEGQYLLPDDFEWFTEVDWMGFGDASRFANGVRPVIGHIKVKTAERVDGPDRVDEVPVVISGSEQDGVKARVEVSFFEEENLNPTRKFANLHEALEVFHLLRHAPQPTSLDQLARLGFASPK